MVLVEFLRIYKENRENGESEMKIEYKILTLTSGEKVKLRCKLYKDSTKDKIEIFDRRDKTYKTYIREAVNQK